MSSHWSTLALVALCIACGVTPPSEGTGSGGSTFGSGGTTSASGGATTGTGGSNGGTSSTGGGTATGGDGSGGDCARVEELCQLLSNVDQGISMKDARSARKVVGHYCLDSIPAIWTTEEICPYSSECNFTTKSCVPCGDPGRKTGLYMDGDGVVTHECEGCACGFWTVADCTTDTTEYGEPYVLVNFQITDIVSPFHVTESAQTWSEDQNDIVIVSNVSFTVAPGALIEFDIAVDTAFVNQQAELDTGHFEGHVVGTCPL